MLACYKWNYLVIFKAHCEFTGANDALKPFNLLTICFATEIKKMLTSDQCDHIIAKSLVINYGASFININIQIFLRLRTQKNVSINVNKAY